MKSSVRIVDLRFSNSILLVDYMEMEESGTGVDGYCEKSWKN